MPQKVTYTSLMDEMMKHDINEDTSSNKTLKLSVVTSQWQSISLYTNKEGVVKKKQKLYQYCAIKILLVM